jgi:hypothetical protein
MPKELIINDADFATLSNFEKSSIRLLSRTYGLLKNAKEKVSLKMLQEIYEKWGEHKTDPEKMYLIALFFPERVQKVHQINPFPYYFI